MAAGSHRDGPDGLRRRFHRQLREALLRSTGPEAVQLMALDRAVRAGHIALHDASRDLNRLLRHQHQRALA